MSPAASETGFVINRGTAVGYIRQYLNLAYSSRIQIGRKPISDRRSTCMNIHLSSSKNPIVAFRKKIMDQKKRARAESGIFG